VRIEIIRGIKKFQIDHRAEYLMQCHFKELLEKKRIKKKYIFDHEIVYGIVFYWSDKI